MSYGADFYDDYALWSLSQLRKRRHERLELARERMRRHTAIYRRLRDGETIVVVTGRSL